MDSFLYSFFFKGGMEKRLYRSEKNKVIAGVCSGIGEYLGVDPVIVRLIWVVFTFIWGIGLLVYLVAWLIVPLKSELPPLQGSRTVIRVVKRKSAKKRRR